MASILVVDDRPINREFLATLLGYAGHRVAQAADGAEALQLIDQHVPDLVISDILMPVMDGIEFAKRVAARPRERAIPIIFYTATHRLNEAQALGRSCGVSTVIPKPSEPQALLDAVHRELGLPRVQLARSTDEPGERGPAAFGALRNDHLEELAELQLFVKKSLDRQRHGDEAQRLDQLSSRVDASFVRAQALSMRLAGVIELGVDLAKQNDPAKMLAMFCHAAHDIMDARVVGACILDEAGQLRDYAAWGMPTAQLAAVRAELRPHDGLLGELLQSTEPRRADGATTSVLGLPASHPPVGNLLGAAVRSADRVYGWFYAADRLGGGLFPRGDEQIALTLASQLASKYENRLLIDRVQRHAALLEVEVDERKLMLERLHESELRFRQLAENIRDVFFLVDSATAATLYVSPAYAEIWQRDPAELYLGPTTWLDTLHPSDRPMMAELFEKSLTTTAFHVEYRILRPDGSLRWIKARGFPIRDASGAVYRIAGLAEDITESKVQELSIRRLSRIHRVLSGINSAIVRIHERDALFDEACRIAVDEGGFPIAWIALLDPGRQTMRPVASRGIDAETFAELGEYLNSDRAREWGPSRRALETREPHMINDLQSVLAPTAGPVVRLAAARGYGSLVSLPLLPNGEPVGVIVLYAEEAGFFDEQELALLKELAGDVSFALQYISKEEQLRYLAYYDPLTGLPNSTLFRERLSQIVRRQSRRSAALFLVDLDRFAVLNDSLGRHVGDRVLVSVGERLQAAIPEGATLGRVGADTFAIAVPELRHETEAGTILHEKLLAALGKQLAVGEHELRISARAGVAVYPSDGDDAEELLINAEAALNEAKASGARFLFYSPQLNARVADDLALEQQMLSALEREEFLVHYQPKVAAKSGVLTGVEALLRWQNRKGAAVGPDRFIRVLEESELILDVGRWVIERALADYKLWRDAGLRPPRVAVNVSPIQLRYADFAEMVIAVLDRAGVDGAALELEITESVIMTDIEANIERLQRLSDRGVTIAIDDFGTGYSSLRYLAKLPVHTLKIDRSFIVSMATDADSMTLVSTIVGLAHSFDLKVVAEGVDSEDQAQLLRLMKCDALQGYLFGKPVPRDAVARLLTQQEP